MAKCEKIALVFYRAKPQNIQIQLNRGTAVARGIFFVTSSTQR